MRTEKEFVADVAKAIMDIPINPAGDMIQDAEVMTVEVSYKTDIGGVPIRVTAFSDGYREEHSMIVKK